VHAIYRFRIRDVGVVTGQDALLGAIRFRLGAGSHGVPGFVFALVEDLRGELAGLERPFFRLLGNEPDPPRHIAERKPRRTRAVAFEPRAHVLFFFCRIGGMLELPGKSALAHVFPTGEVDEVALQFDGLAVKPVDLRSRGTTRHGQSQEQH